MAVNTPEFPWSNTRYTKVKVLRTRSVTDINEAEHLILTHLQQNSFSEDFQNLKSVNQSTLLVDYENLMCFC